MGKVDAFPIFNIILSFSVPVNRAQLFIPERGLSYCTLLPSCRSAKVQ